MEEDLEMGVRLLSPVTKNKKGKFVHKRERLLVINLFKDLKNENPNINKASAYDVLAKKTRLGLSTIKSTILEYERTGNVASPNKKRIRLSTCDQIDEFARNATRKKVHEFYMNKQLPRLAKVLRVVNNDENLPNFKRTTFWKLLKELNFKYVGRTRNSVLTERDDLILWRRNYLKSIKKFREKGRPIYYLDETWINAGDVSPKIWMDATIRSKKDAFLRGLTTGPSNPTGRGKRLIIVHIGSRAGFVPGGLLCFESKKNTADYHDDMNGDTFLEWFEHILPRLEKDAVIVMDNAPYHSVKLEKIPTSSWNKAAIIEWIQNKGMDVDTTLLKAELLYIVNLTKPAHNKYVIDEKAKECNKRVLRLPPYHCELNPIEMVWSMVKGYVKSNNNTFKLDDVKRLLEEGVERVTAENWSNFVRHVIKEEQNLWEIDNIADRMIDEIAPFVIDVGNESDSDSDFSDE